MLTDLVFRADPYAPRCEATVIGADASGVRLDRTVFYPTGGGQPGDIGTLVLADGTRLPVTTAVKGETEDDVVHVLPEGVAAPAIGTTVTAELDWERRHRLMRMHSCMHLLCATVEGGVTGGQVGADRGRLDFDLPDTSLDKEAIAAAINRLIEEDHPIEARWIEEAELEANPDLVRTMSVKPPTGSGRVRVIAIGGGAVDLQPCGGTHVRRTGEIGRIVVAKIENKGKHNRRINLAFAE